LITTLLGPLKKTIEVEVHGYIHVRFWDRHTGGDATLFVFKDNNPYYILASHSMSWEWLARHCDTALDADNVFHYQDIHLVHSGKVKLIVKFYSGSTSWAIGYDVENISATSDIPQSNKFLFYLLLGLGLIAIMLITLLARRK